MELEQKGRGPPGPARPGQRPPPQEAPLWAGSPVCWGSGSFPDSTRLSLSSGPRALCLRPSRTRPPAGKSEPYCEFCGAEAFGDHGRRTPRRIESEAPTRPLRMTSQDDFLLSREGVVTESSSSSESQPHWSKPAPAHAVFLLTHPLPLPAPQPRLCGSSHLVPRFPGGSSHLLTQPLEFSGVAPPTLFHLGCT